MSIPLCSLLYLVWLSTCRFLPLWQVMLTQSQGSNTKNRPRDQTYWSITYHIIVQIHYYTWLFIFADKALKASYTPSPLRRPLTGDYKTPQHLLRSAVTTPTHLTPKSARSQASTPKTSDTSHAADLTDNLLNLPTKRKSKAADYF